MKSFWHRHTAFSFFAFLMAVQLLSVYVDSGSTYMRVNWLYTFLLVFFYIFADVTLRHRLVTTCDRFHSWCRSMPRLLKLATYTLDAVVILFPVAYFASVGYVPFVRLMYMDDYYAASGLRQVFFNALPPIMNYGGEYLLRGIAPVWLVYCYINRRRAIFYISLFTLSFQSLGIITKASIVILLFPLLIIQLSRRDWWHGALSAAAIALVLTLNVTVLHRTVLTHMVEKAAAETIAEKKKEAEIIPDSRIVKYLQNHLDESETTETIIEKYKSAEIVIEGLWTRIFSVNGKIVTQWLETFPADKGFQHGCGYRWYAAIKGCEFVKLPDMIWLKYFDRLHKEYNIMGTVSAPHYINAYANFAEDGVILAAIGMALLLVLLNAVFLSPAMAFAFSASALGLALQTPLTAILNSCGLGLTMLMVLAFFPRGARM